MAGYISNWKLTITAPGTPLVVVDHGDKIPGLLKLGWAQTTQAAPGLRTRDLKTLARGNVARELVISVYRDHATMAAALNWSWEMDNATVDAYALAMLSLRLVVQGGNTYDIAEAVLRDVTTDQTEITPLRTLTTWRFLRGPAVLVP